MDDSPELTVQFAENYFAARAQFLQRAANVGFRVDSHSIAAKGPQREPLFIDVAVRDGAGTGPWRTVIVSSGLHGVEGFLGSAVQCAALERLLGAEPTACPRLVFIHALNPFGFAWIRRCNEDNVDLNRNFLDDVNAYRGSPEKYAKLNNMLNRKSPPSPWEPFRLLGLLAILRYGIPALKRAIASGQYDYPQGLFYGGSGVCETTRFVQENFVEWLGTNTGPVLHLDFHSGLGRRGACHLLADLPPTAVQAERIRSVFGREVQAGMQSSTVSYIARGSIGEWCQKHAVGRDYSYLCAEFGTCPPLKVLTALRAENRAQHWDRPGSATYRWAKELLREAFCPRSLDWRQTAAATGLELIERAIAAKPPTSPGGTP